jgi:hypothetical protein
VTENGQLVSWEKESSLGGAGRSDYRGRRNLGDEQMFTNLVVVMASWVYMY